MSYAENSKIAYSCSPSNSEVTIDGLNDDCLEKIFRFLPLTDRVRIERGTSLK